MINLKHIEELRKERDWTQAELAKQLNISQQAISKYEKECREPDIDVLIRIAKLFNVSVDYLLGMTDSPNNTSSQNDISNNIFPERLKYLLSEDLDITFYSNVAKIPVEMLEKYMAGTETPGIYELCKIIEVFDTSADYLFGKSNIPHPKNNFHKVSYSENNFPSRLSYEMDGNFLETELAEKLNISISTVKAMLSGTYTPNSDLLFRIAQILEKSTDYLLGISEKSRPANFKGIYPFETNQTSLQRIQNLLESDNNEYLEKELGLHDGELYYLYHYGFIPNINVINKLCKYFSVSADYLLGISDCDLSIIVNKDINEGSLIKTYRQLGEHYRKKIDGEVSEQLLQQERDAYMRLSVAADVPSKQPEVKKTMGK